MSKDETAKEILEEIADTQSLTLAIEKLELRKEIQEEELSKEFHTLLNSLKPGNILKSTLNEIRESTPLKNNLLKVALGLGVGYFSRKMVVTKSAGVTRRALGAALQYGITHFIARKDDSNGQARLSGGGPIRNWFKKIFSR